MKKLFTLLLKLTIIAGIFSGVTIMENGEFVQCESNIVTSVDRMKSGDYFILGKYNNEPILWRYVADDEHGKLVVSDKSLCQKVFGESNFWEESFIRKWLNSSAAEGETKWEFGEIPSYCDVKLDPREKGFLHESNFSYAERSVMKTVTQWTMLPEDHLDLATNGIKQPYCAIKEIRPGDPQSGGGKRYYDSSELPDVYFGAAHEVTDTVFLIDEMQVYHIWESIGRYNFGTPDAKALYLRTPSKDKVTAIQHFNYVAWATADYPCDIRPAFNLDTDNAVILSGSGTEDDPYIIDGKYVGEVVSTDIIAQINGSFIPSYNINGNTAISAEDLSYYGFDIDYDDTTRTLNVNRLPDKESTPIDSADERFRISGEIGTKLYDIYRSDIKVFLDGERVDSFNIDGRSLIYIDALGKYGDVFWDENNRTISVHYGEK